MLESLLTENSFTLFLRPMRLTCFSEKLGPENLLFNSIKGTVFLLDIQGIVVLDFTSVCQLNRLFICASLYITLIIELKHALLSANK